MSYWESNLLEARLQAGGAELEFPIADRQVSGGRAFARRRYPFRDGQSDEDTGGEPRTIVYRVPLFRDVEEEHYPNLFFDLIEFFESDIHKGRATLTDPEFGPIPVRLIEYSWDTNAQARGGGELTLNFETLGHENFLLLTVEGDSVAPGEDAARLDEALAEAGITPVESAQAMRRAGAPLSGSEVLALGLSASFAANIGPSVHVGIGLGSGVNVGFGVSLPAGPPATSASVSTRTGFAPNGDVPDDEVQLFSALLERFESRIATGAIWGSDEVGAELDTLLARIASVRATVTASVGPERGWPVLAASSRLMASARRLADGAFGEAGRRVVDHTLTAEQSAVEVAVALFGDPNRVVEIIELNPSVSPDFLPAGTTLSVPLE